MEALNLLEQKIVALLGVVTSLREENTLLAKENKELEKSNEQLDKEKVQLAKTVADLKAKIEKVEGAVVEGSKNIDSLSKERERTRLAVDDLLKNIDALLQKVKSVMSKEKKRYQATIFGDTYSLVSDEDALDVERAAQQLDVHMKEIAERSGCTDTKSIAVLAALKFVRALHEAEQRANLSHLKIQALIERIAKEGLPTAS